LYICLSISLVEFLVIVVKINNKKIDNKRINFFIIL